MTVKIKTKDKEFTLEYGFNSLIDLEEYFGVKMLEGQKVDFKTISLKQLREFLWFGLKANHPEFKNADAVGNIIQIDKLPEIIEKMAEAVSEGIKKPDEQIECKVTDSE